MPAQAHDIAPRALQQNYQTLRVCNLISGLEQAEFGQITGDVK